MFSVGKLMDVECRMKQCIENYKNKVLKAFYDDRSKRYRFIVIERNLDDFYVSLYPALHTVCNVKSDCCCCVPAPDPVPPIHGLGDGHSTLIPHGRGGDDVDVGHLRFVSPALPQEACDEERWRWS
ncbi:hypothetical protein ElyMa_005498400 [Elysia marginata]|uniref:Uncharacterized protein n=1 Tax=Elysia marginata TaxID=1093978 RepID=A0AAV4ESG4_9GAST|nr:hypothetical protein ElyMa_005498400 [Elysia marginata]